MARGVYAPDGSLNVTITNDDGLNVSTNGLGKGAYAPDGSLRVTVVQFPAVTGLTVDGQTDTTTTLVWDTPNPLVESLQVFWTDDPQVAEDTDTTTGWVAGPGFTRGVDAEFENGPAVVTIPDWGVHTWYKIVVEYYNIAESNYVETGNA